MKGQRTQVMTKSPGGGLPSYGFLKVWSVEVYLAHLFNVVDGGVEGGVVMAVAVLEITEMMEARSAYAGGRPGFRPATGWGAPVSAYNSVAA